MTRKSNAATPLRLVESARPPSAAIGIIPDLDCLRETWQRRLGLRDWTVTVKLCRARDMDDEDSNGEVQILLNHRRAFIALRDPLDVKPEYHPENDLEETLVHELLHLWTEPLSLPDAGPRQVAEEQALNALAKALVALAREADPDG